MKTFVSSSLVGSGLEMYEVSASADADVFAALTCRTLNLLSEMRIALFGYFCMIHGFKLLTMVIGQVCHHMVFTLAHFKSGVNDGRTENSCVSRVLRFTFKWMPG